jgi:hypothetical protein
MNSSKPTTNFAEIAAGFLTGMNVVGPLIRGYVQSQGEAPPPSAYLRLENPEKKFFVDPMREPMAASVNGDAPDANFFVTIDAEMFHYLIWGKLPIARALNEKVALVESNRIVPPENQSTIAITGGPLIFNNPLYEMYLIRIGAGRLISENSTPQIPLPGEKRPIREIPLEPTPEKSILGAAANALARVMGWMAGLALRLLIKLRKEEDLDAPLEYSAIPDPRPPNPPASSGVRLALMKVLFKRINIFEVIDNLGKGIMATGPFKSRRAA